MEKKRRRRLAIFAVCAAAAMTAVIGSNNDLAVRTYEIVSEKLTRPLRLALLTDLHSCAYGAGQRELLDAVAGLSPDLVLLGGDIVDDDPTQPEENAWIVVRALAERYTTYYVTGNHEFWSGRAEEIKERMSDCGVIVLNGGCDTVVFQGQVLELCGIDDPAVGEAAWHTQLEKAISAAEPGRFTILLTHRPERVEEYRQYPIDLTLAGHAHGGQWRIPGLLNGLLAPDQGLFPAYAGGLYQIGDGALIVSRGLALESTRLPRLFNPPELVCIDLIPEQGHGDRTDGSLP